MQNERKRQLFLALTEEHIATGNPVGSQVLSKKSGIRCSSATVRNEFAELENDGFIFQPHTSAGRIPTEKGWKYYIDNLMKEQAPSKRNQDILERALGKKDAIRESMKSLAKELAELSKETAFVGFSKDDVYYTGIANLFSEPEFAEVNMLRDMSVIIDHFDEVIDDLYDSLENGTHVLVGKDNPFGRQCGVVVNKFKSTEGDRLYGILGPARMEYASNVGLVNFATSLLIK